MNPYHHIQALLHFNYKALEAILFHLDQYNKFTWVWQNKNPESDAKLIYLDILPMIIHGNVL